MRWRDERADRGGSSGEWLGRWQAADAALSARVDRLLAGQSVLTGPVVASIEAVFAADVSAGPNNGLLMQFVLDVAFTSNEAKNVT